MASEAVEIERKFLVERLPDLSAASKAIICQGYLTDAADSVEMRLRQKNDVYYLTLKADGGITRLEREAEITKVQFDTFWPQTVGRRVEKVRWTGALSDGLSYELDLFDGELAGLQMVEVEFPSENAAMILCRRIGLALM